MDIQRPVQQQPSEQSAAQQPVQPVPVVARPSQSNWKVIILAGIGILILGGASYGAYYYWQTQKLIDANKPVACTQEAKLCSDGSSVSRTGPNCEFAECPADPTADWQTYKNDQYEFKYPSKVILTENKNQIVLNHKIPYENHGSCDMKGDSKTYPTLDDLNMAIKVIDNPLVKTVQTLSPYLTEENFVGDSLVISPGFIDEYKNGVLRGFSIYEGAEGCGDRKYYFPVTTTKTLVITNEQVQMLSGIIEASIRNEVLKVPGVISREENEKIFNQILSTLKFTAQ